MFEKLQSKALLLKVSNMQNDRLVSLLSDWMSMHYYVDLYVTQNNQMNIFY